MKILFLLITLTACATIQSAQNVTNDLDTAQISFISDRIGNPEIYVMNTDGTGQIPITDFGTRIRNPAWSPDGKQIAYSADDNGNAEIYVVDVNCEPITIACLSAPTNLSSMASDDIESAWSPDGNRIVFRSGRDDYLWNIFIVDLPQANLTQITDDFNNLAPTWSPDGTQLAVQSLRDENWDIYILNLDGSASVRLTDHEALDYRPRWSPDGSKIAFDSLRDGNWEIYILDLNCDTSAGDCTINLTNHAADDGGAAWSPDSSRIAFTSDRDGNFEIYTMNVDGSDVVRMTNNEFTDTEPTWRVFAE